MAASSPSPPPTLQVISPEHLVTISTYLPTSDVWSLASINTFTLSTLLHETGALREIWMRNFQSKFPVVFDQHRLDLDLASTSACSASNANGGTATDVQSHSPASVSVTVTKTEKDKNTVMIVDQLNNHFRHLHTSSTDDPSNSNSIHCLGGNDGKNRDSELGLRLRCLPQLSNLLPASYPQSIDFIQMPSKESFKIISGTLAGTGSRSIDDDDEPVPLASHDKKVLLIKFTGSVGHGDRSIRSDAAFPLRLRTFPSHYSSREKCSSSNWTAPFSWKRFTGAAAAAAALRINASTKGRGRQSRPVEADGLSVDSESTLRSSFGESTMSTLTLSDERPTRVTPTRDVIASLLHPIREEDINEVVGVGLKQIMNRGNKNRRASCPFVIPTIVSEQEDVMVVDVTPRFVAYYEVSILNGEGKSFAASQSADEEVHQQLGDEGQQEIQEEQNRQEEDYTRDQSRSGCISVGLSTLSSELENNMPGWDQHSYGYHGDDGRTFHRGKRSSGDMTLPVFGVGDTIGCGIEYSSNGGRLFFVKNGTLLRESFHSISKRMLGKGLYPTVGIDSRHPIHVNFGQVPFKFELLQLL